MPGLDSWQNPATALPVQQGGVGGGIPMLQDLANLQQTTNANRLYQARQGVGQLLQQSIDPSTGQPDLPTFNRLLAAHPELGIAAPDAAQVIQSIRTSQLANTQTGLGISGTAIGNLASDIASVPANPDKADDPAVMQARAARVAAGLAAGRYGPQGAQIASAYAGNGGFTDAKAKQFAIQTGSATEGEAQGIPTISPTQVGPNVVGVTTNPVQGTMGTTGAPIPVGLTAPQKTDMRTFIGQDNAQHAVSVGALFNDDGSMRPNIRAADGTQITDATGAMVTGLRPGVAEQASAAATGGVQQGLGIQGGIVNAALDSQQRRAQLGTVIGLSKQLSTGPNAQFWKGLGELATEYGIDPRKLGIPWDVPGQAAGMEALDKIAWQVAQRQFQVLGGTGSNMQLDSAIHTSPSSSMTGQGIRNISGFLQGNEDAIQAEARAMQKWNEMPAHRGHPESLVNFPNVWNSIYDPRAFQFKYEDADGQKAILDGMSAKEQAEFKRRQRLMTDMGYLSQ